MVPGIPHYCTEGFGTTSTCQRLRKSLLLQRLPSAFGQRSTFRSSCNIYWHKYANTKLKMGESCSACWLLLPDVFQAGWVGWQGGGKQWSHTGCRCCSEIQKPTVIQLFHVGFQSQHCRACSNFSLYLSQALLWHSSC